MLVLQSTKLKTINKTILIIRVTIPSKNKILYAEMYLKFIANYNKSDAQYKLAKLYENKLKFDDAIEYFEDYINLDIPQEEKDNVSKLIVRIQERKGN